MTVVGVGEAHRGATGVERRRKTIGGEDKRF
jgi:hypothetical protein